jgi:hypothetical protein
MSLPTTPSRLFGKGPGDRYVDLSYLWLVQKLSPLVAHSSGRSLLSGRPQMLRKNGWVYMIIHHLTRNSAAVPALLKFNR